MLRFPSSLKPDVQISPEAVFQRGRRLEAGDRLSHNSKGLVKVAELQHFLLRVEVIALDAVPRVGLGHSSSPRFLINLSEHCQTSSWAGVGRDRFLSWGCRRGDWRSGRQPPTAQMRAIASGGLN
jgi:hypothetical protein